MDLKERWDKLTDLITETQAWKTTFRHGYAPTERNRLLFTINNFFLHLHPAKVRQEGIRFFHTYCLGGLTFLLFILLTITGVLLMFYYVPDARRAYWDMKDLEFAISYGMILRNMHRWSAHAMVITVWLHMLRVFLTGSYKPPREFNWAVGVILLVLTLLLSFSGYLLPWDQLAIWAVTVGTTMAKNTPVLGAEGPFSIVDIKSDAAFVLRAGTTVWQGALLRFYVLHCIFFPLIAGLLMAIHFWRVRKDGGISLPPL